MKVAPLGNAPDSVRVGAGFPDATMVNEPLVPTGNAALFALGIVGAVGLGGPAAPCPPPPVHPARTAAKTMVIKKVTKLNKGELLLQACDEKALRCSATSLKHEYI